MSNYTLSAPQKIALGFGIFVFCVGFMSLVGFTYLNWQNNRPLPITITPSAAYPKDAQGNTLTKGTAYGSTIVQGNEGYSTLSWGNNKLVLFAGTRAIVSQSGVELLAGRAFLLAQNTGNLSLQGGLGSIQNGSITIDHNQAEIVIHSGGVALADGRSADINKQINYSGTVRITNFDRSSLRSDPNWQYVITVVQSLNLAPLSLQDITPPVISNLFPASGAQFTEREVTITGELSDDNATLYINNLPVSLANGKFSYTLQLNEGENKVFLQMSDQQNNQDGIEVVYTYQPPVQTIN